MKKRRINIYDIRIKELYDAVHEARDRLIAKTQAAITKKAVIDLYPEGADKQAAIKALDDAKYSLLCAIGYYDERLNEACQYYANNNGNFDECWATPNNFAKSHDIIEYAYRHYFKHN